jgi:hypothetical protein
MFLTTFIYLKIKAIALYPLLSNKSIAVIAEGYGLENEPMLLLDCPYMAKIN